VAAVRGLVALVVPGVGGGGNGSGSGDEDPNDGDNSSDNRSQCWPGTAQTGFTSVVCTRCTSRMKSAVAVPESTKIPRLPGRQLRH